MIDDALIQSVQKIANYRLKKNYPLLGETHYSESDVRYILESLAMILEEYELSQNTREIIKENFGMKFNEQNKVIIDTMDNQEARAFVKFLQSEIARHKMDIDNARDLIKEVNQKFEILGG